MVALLIIALFVICYLYRAQQNSKTVAIRHAKSIEMAVADDNDVAPAHSPAPAPAHAQTSGNGNNADDNDGVADGNGYGEGDDGDIVTHTESIAF